MNNQKGYIAYVLIVFAILIGLMLFPLRFPTPHPMAPKPTCVAGEEPGAGDTMEISVPPVNPEGGFLEGQPVKKYELVRKNVLTSARLNAKDVEFFTTGLFRNNTSPHLVLLSDPSAFGGDIPHGYTLFYPGWAANIDLDLQRNGGAQRLGVALKSEGMVLLSHGIGGLTTFGYRAPIPGETPVGNGALYMVDVYQYKEIYDKVKAGDYAYTYDEFFSCNVPGPIVLGQPAPPDGDVPAPIDVPPAPSVAPLSVVIPSQSPSTTRDQLQLEWFLFGGPKSGQGVWTAHCKPAVYLYPPEKELVNVKVLPQGFLSYTDPPYDPEKGWNVQAYPDGKLLTMNDEPITHNYLYFESKIRDEVIQKPTKGWVVKYEDLDNLYQNILPKLGLNPKQTQDFREYWTKALHPAPYYFVGIIDQNNVNQIEKLEITPKPDSVNRVRVYFERLDQPKTVEAPVVTNHSSLVPNNFKVVEWGGMVKNDPDHPFTCSQ